MSMKAKILELLREKKEQVAAGAPESEAYVSGQELCEQFGVSRTAVWKAIGQLKKEGYVIEAVQNRGYRLVDQTEEVYNQADIQSRLKTNWVGHPLLFLTVLILPISVPNRKRNREQRADCWSWRTSRRPGEAAEDAAGRVLQESIFIIHCC